MRPSTHKQIIIGSIGSLFAAALITGLRLWLDQSDASTTDLFLLFLGSLLVVAFAISGCFYVGLRAIRGILLPKIREEIHQELRDEVRAEMTADLSRELETKTGIVKIFPNFSSCEEEILRELQNSSENRVFLQLGRSVVSGGRDFFDRLDRAVRPGGNVRVLHASSESPYLSERVANTRGSSFALWRADLDHATKRIDALAAEINAKIEGRRHREGYVWRFFITENLAYIQPYLYPRKNSERAPVLKVARRLTGSGEANEASLFIPFSTYFDQKWDENAPRRDSLRHIINPSSTIVATAAIRYNQFAVFCIPRRYLDKFDTEIPFHGVGGKLEFNEDLFEGLNRESKEEIGIDLEVEASAKTRYLTTGADLGTIDLDDKPRPYCLYKRSRDADPNFTHKDVLWLVGYEAKPCIRKLDEILPRKEIAAVLILTSEMLLRTLHEKVTFADIDKANDGSRVVRAEHLDFDESKRAVPAGLATIVASEQRPRLARRL